MHPEDATEKMIRQAANGDALAFETLIEPYEKRLYALCLRIAGNREDAMDCAQEAMLRIWRSLPKYRFQSALTTWCYRIATNACLDLLRRHRARPQVSLDALTEDGFAPADEISREGNPEENSEENARRAALQQAILALPPEMRAALVLRDVQGLSYDEISEILTLPAGTVKSRLNRAREKLRQALLENSRNLELFSNSRVQTDEGRRQA